MLGPTSMEAGAPKCVWPGMLAWWGEDFDPKGPRLLCAVSRPCGSFVVAIVNNTFFQRTEIPD